MAQMKYKAILDTLQNIEDPAQKAQLAANFLHELIGCPTKMMKFLESGQEIDLEVLNKKRTLHKVCKSGNVGLVRELLKFKLNVNSRDKNGGTALHVACSEGHFEIVKELLKNGAWVNVNYRNKKNSPLYIATEGRHIEIVKELLKAGADIDFTSKISKYQPIHVACMKNCSGLIALLLKNGCETNSRDIHGQTPLFILSAKASCSIQIFRQLLKSGANPDIPDNQHNSPLMGATACNNTKVLVELLKNGADPNLQNYLGKTALQMAVFNGYEEIVSELLIFGANPNIKNRHGSTALHEAATHIRESVEIVEDLLRYGANINAQNKNGQTPLHCFVTICNRNPKYNMKITQRFELLLKTLLNAPGINLSIRCDGGSTALEMAIQHRMIHVARMIAIKACPKPKITDSIYPLKKLF